MNYHVISYLEAAASKSPEKIAVASKSHQLSYRALWEKTTAIGSGIFQRLQAVRQPVFVCLRHDVADILAFLSVAYSGNFYVPVDLSLPGDRIKHMAKAIRPAAVLGQEDLPFLSAPRWSLEELEGQTAPPSAPWKRCKDTDLLYVIFTSGSTGVPKGVAVRHRSVIDMAEQFAAVFGFDDTVVFGNQAPFDFDVSVKDIYLTLKLGGRLEILEKQLFSFPKLLIQRLNDRKINTLIWAVPALKIIATLKAFQKDKPLYLQNVLFSGEVLPPKALHYWENALPNVRYCNLYGPTEITCNCTYYVLDPEQSYESGIPIGTAFPNCSVFLLEGDHLVLEPDTPGELCVTGTCLAAGYYGQAELTAAAFPQAPEAAFPERMYRTGDIGLWRDGLLWFLGRKDTQIKHMGHRIELGELELTANRFPGVLSSACVYLPEQARIALCYQGSAAPEDLRDFLKTALPKYMLPAVLRPVTAFPQTRTGKVDRLALKNLIEGEEHHG